MTFAARLARHAGARLHVAHAQDPLLAHAARAAGVDIDAETRAELSAFMQTAPPSGDWSPFQEVADGPAVNVLCDAADRVNADVIVVGTHGMSGIGRLMFGSTTEGVLRAADHSVFVIPDSWTPPHGDADDLSGMGPVVAGVELTRPPSPRRRPRATWRSCSALHLNCGTWCRRLRCCRAGPRMPRALSASG